jgi:MFS family permease
MSEHLTADDQNLLNGLQAIPQWQEYFHKPSSARLGLATASVFFPAVVTAFLGDWMAARFGRKWGIVCGASMIIAGAFVNAFATDFNSTPARKPR